VKEVSGGFEALCRVFDSLDLRFVEKNLLRCYRPKESVGRPHRNLLGMFKAELIKRLQDVESYRKLHRLLHSDETIRSLCDIEEGEKPYSRPTLARFRQRVGPERFQRIMTHLIKELDRLGVMDAETLAVDATFLKAYSRRDPKDSQRGLSDSDARLRKQGRNTVLGYGVHLAADAASEMPLAAIVEPANVNEKKVAPLLLRKAATHKRRIKNMAADSQYSSEAVREEVKRLGGELVIPYPKNQMKGKRVLRVDRKFRTHGPARLKRLYRRRSAVERTISRLKIHYGLNQLRTRGLRNAMIHVFLCLIAMLVTALASIILGHADMMRSPVRLYKLTGGM